MGTRTLRMLLFTLVLGLLASQSAFADVYATIRGTVTDPSGAVIAGAQVTATNTLTGISKTVTSQANGSYEFLQLPTGPYTVTVTKSGFKTFKSSAFTLTVNQIYNLAAKMEVGQATETVEVTANPIQVERTSIQQSTLISSQQIVDLPLNGRNFTQLEQLAPGVMSSSDRFGTFSVNGSQTQQSNYLINGTDTNDIALNTPGLLPSPDAIQEFNLISSTINPEYGRNSGGIVNATIKSGTNSFHGDIFDFYRDTFLNSRGFFSGATQPVFHQNQFGGTFGGPIKKDKTFFFLSYQGTYNRVDSNAAGQSSSQSTTVYSPDQRNGIFPALAKSTTKSPFAMVGEDGNTHPAGTPYNVLFPTGHIPQADFNSISSKLLNQFIPLPNGPNNTFTFNPVNTSHTDQGIAKIDHNLSQNDQIWGLFAVNNQRGAQALPFTGSTLPGFGTVQTAKTYDYTAAWNHTFNSTMLNELRLGYFRFNFDTVEPAQTVDPSTFGFTNIKLQNPAAAQLPKITIGNTFTIGFSNNGPQPRKDQNYQLTDNFSKIIGNHTLKFGFDGRRFQVDNPFFFNIDGVYGFNGNGAFSTGDGFADFLLGIPDGFSQGSGAAINARAYEYYAYAQDQWKVRNNLTLTLGAGYQIDTPYNNNQFGGLAFNCFIPGQQSKVFPAGVDPVTGNPTGAPLGLNYPGDPGCTNSGTTIKYGHIAPRFGFAYSPDQSKTSIRGGVGVYYNRYEEETALQNLAAPPFGLGSSGVGDVGGSPSFADPWTDISGAGSIPNKFPFTPPAAGSAVDFSFFEPLTLNLIDPKQSTPRSVNYNLNIQRELPARTVVSVGYVGAMGRHLYRAYDINPITLAGAQACAADPFCVAHRNIQHFLFPDHAVVPPNPAQCPITNADCFGGLGTQFTDGTSNYNAFQANVTKGESHGLAMIVSYTWSHSIDDGSGFENSGFGARGTNPFFANLNIGDSGFDARQRLVISPIYNIPSLHHLISRAPEAIFGGWRLSSIMTFQTGFPINPSDTGFRSLTCDAQTFYGCPDNPNQVVSSVATFDPRASTSHAFFAKTDFTRQVIGTFGNSGRNSIHGPGINNFDMSLTKDTKMTERTSFQVGMDLFNVFNHTQFNLPSGNIASSLFGRVTSAAPARIAQIRAKIFF